MFRRLPPVGTHIYLGEIFAGLSGGPGKNKIVENFRNAVADYFRVKHCSLASSGRAALTIIFRAMHKLRPEKNVVILPAYTSYSVPAAAVKAGLKISLCDIDPNTLSIDIESLKRAITGSTLCIVVCHLYGYPANIDVVTDIAKERNIYVVDDAAQSMGAKHKGRFTGTFGDAGVFSLNRGKNITTAGGGIIITGSDNIAYQIAAIKLKKVSMIDRAVIFLKLLIMSVLMNPRIYWLTGYMPFLKLGESVFSINFDIKEFTGLQAAVGLNMLKRLEGINKARVINAGKLMSCLKGNDKVRCLQIIESGKPVFLRLAVLCKELLKFERRSLGVVRSYPCPIDKIETLKPYLTNASEEFPGAKILSENLLTLPTHSGVCDSDIRSIKDLFK